MRRSIERVIAEDSGKGDFIASGEFGRVHQHGHNRVYKEARLDGTAVWLERCFAIQKRLGMEHPLCAMMPEIFSFRKIGHGCYEVVMAKYRRLYDCNGEAEYALWATCPMYKMKTAEIVDAVLGKHHDGYSFADDLHRGNLLYCDKRGWIITDPSCDTYKNVSRGVQDPKFARANRVATQYGPTRRQ